jgi:uncharacterized protein (TIGR02118 family)
VIRVSVMYPTAGGKKFDHDYCAKTHMAPVHARLDSLGLRRTEVGKGLGSGIPGAPAPYAAVGHVYFDSVAAFPAAMKAHGKELFDHVPNFTDIQPQVQISGMIA